MHEEMCDCMGRCVYLYTSICVSLWSVGQPVYVCVYVNFMSLCVYLFVKDCACVNLHYLCVGLCACVNLCFCVCIQEYTYVYICPCLCVWLVVSLVYCKHQIESLKVPSWVHLCAATCMPMLHKIGSLWVHSCVSPSV